MKNHRNILKQIYKSFIGMLVVALALMIWWGVGSYNKRKACEIARLSRIPQKTEQASDGRDSISVQEVDFSQNQVTWAGKKYRRNTYIQAILCMGIDRNGELDYRTDDFTGQSDGLCLVAQDTVHNTVRLLMIPRDTMTDVKITNQNGEVTKTEKLQLTLAYAFGDGREKSCEYAAWSVSNVLLGLPIEHYIAADLEIISTMNDAVGGVTVTVPQGMAAADPAFTEGNVITLKGKQAERFVRYRDIAEDFSALYRMNRHRIYIDGFLQAVKQRSGTTGQTVEYLLDLIQDYMVTDLDKGNLMKVALDGLSTEQLTGERNCFTVPGTGITTDRFDEYYVNQEELIPILLELFYRPDGLL